MWRETEGPFGKFTGHYSGGRLQAVVEITKVSYRAQPIFERLYIGMPWTEIDYLTAINTSAPTYVQMKAQFPGVEAVNAAYTHDLVLIVSTRRRSGGFAKNVACACRPRHMAWVTPRWSSWWTKRLIRSTLDR